MNVGFFKYLTHGVETIGVNRGKNVYDYMLKVNDEYISLCSLNNIFHPSRDGELEEHDVVYVSIGGIITQGKDAFYLLKSVLRIAGYV